MLEKLVPVVTGVIGAGAISDAYLKNLTGRFSSRIRVKTIAANHIENAEKKAAVYGCGYDTVEGMLGDDEIEMVIILTPVGSHASLIRQALNAGKHVYTEKTITVTSEEAEELISLAEEKGLYLCSAPDTFLGSACETAKKAIEEGMLGDINSFSISICRNNDILTSWFPFLRQPGAGILRDYVVYYLTALCGLLGEAEETAAFLKAPYPERTCILESSPDYGKMISTPNESIMTAILKLKNGITGTLHDDSESHLIDRADFMIYGRKGMLKLADPNHFGGDVYFTPAIPADMSNPQAVKLEPVNAYTDECRGIGPYDLALCIRAGGTPRTDASLALHVLKIMEAMERSSAAHTYEKVAD